MLLAVVLGGRNRDLPLFEVDGSSKSLKEMLKDLFFGLEVVVEILDSCLGQEEGYKEVLEKYRRIFEGKEPSLSERMIEEMNTQKLSYFDLIYNLSEKNKKFFIEKEMASDKERYFIDQSEKSKVEHLKIERKAREPFDVFVKNYLGR